MISWVNLTYLHYSAYGKGFHGLALPFTQKKGKSLIVICFFCGYTLKKLEETRYHPGVRKAFRWQCNQLSVMLHAWTWLYSITAELHMSQNSHVMLTKHN